jgi:hypothetical protein
VVWVHAHSVTGRHRQRVDHLEGVAVSDSNALQCPILQQLFPRRSSAWSGRRRSAKGRNASLVDDRSPYNPPTCSRQELCEKIRALMQNGFSFA